MNRSGRAILLLIAAVIAAFTAVSVRNRLSQAPVAEVPVQSARVVIAKHDLAVGSFVQGAQDLDWGVVTEPVAPTPPVPGEGPAAPEAAMPANAPKEYLHEGAVKLTDFNGAVVRRSLRAGEPVQQSALMRSGEGGFMSAVLEAGKRAVSIGVNATSGNAGFVSPGDHVDLIVTHRIKTMAGGSGSTQAEESVVSETFVHDVRIVAVDQMLDNPENKAILAKTVTVEVSPRQAEEVAVAAEMGKISVALRSLASPDKKQAAKINAADGTPVEGASGVVALYEADSPDSGYTRDSDLSHLLGHRDAIAPRVQVIRGDKSENLDFYQGKQ